LSAFKHKHLLGIKTLTASEIRTILQTAESFLEISTREVKKVPTLRGKTIINLFFEPSTRTRSSFELAAKRLSADIVNINQASSSAVKGESLKDTVLNLEAMSSAVALSLMLAMEVTSTQHRLFSMLLLSNKKKRKSKD